MYFKQLEEKQVREQAMRRLDDAHSKLKWAMNEVESAKYRLENAETDEERAGIMNYMVMFLSTAILSNLRIDLIADSQAKLSKGN
jgi:hypothetical protein